MKQLICALLFLPLGLSTLPAAATCSGNGQARAQLDAFTKNLHSFSAHFVQTLSPPGGGNDSRSYGSLALQAPRQFRWQTTSPYKQLIVADGDKVWMYEPDLEQVTVRPQTRAEASSPLSVLTDVSKLDQEYQCRELGERNGLHWLQLTPKAGQGQFAYVELGFDAKGLQAMVFKDQLANLTRIRFSDLQRNVRLPPDTFRFTPPAGADVIGEQDSGVKLHALSGGS